MSENVPVGSYGESSKRAPSFSNSIKVSTSNLSEHIGATSTIESNPCNYSSNISFRNDFMGATSSFGSLDQNIEGGELLEDIFRVLSEVPLHATKALHESFHHHLEASTSKNEECFMQEKRGIESHDYTNVVSHQRSQIEEGVEAKEDTQPSEPEPTHTLPCDENLDHYPTRRRNTEQRRRERINGKLKTIQALLPASNDHKKDHASILDNAINYIKFLKFQVEMLSTRSIGQSELYGSYNPWMVMGGTGFPQWPLHFPMAGPSNYPLMFQPNFQVRPISQYPVTPLFTPQPISQVLLPPQPSTPIRLQPPIPYIGLSNTSTGLATSPSTTTEQFSNLFFETNQQ